MDNEQKATIKKLSREEFEKDIEENKKLIESLEKYDDYDIWKSYIHLEIITYEEYLKTFDKYFKKEENRYNSGLTGYPRI
jgi:glucose-6-phosphate isomerase